MAAELTKGKPGRPLTREQKVQALFDFVADGVPVVVHSLGKDWAAFSSPDELENVGATIGSGSSYQVNANNVFVSRPFSDAPGGEFDDLLTWLPPNVLYGRLVAAGHLFVSALPGGGSGGSGGNNGNGNGNGGGNGNGNNGNGNGNGGGNGNNGNGNGDGGA